MKPGETVEKPGAYMSETSKKRVTLIAGEPAPATPLKNERWIKAIDMPGVEKTVA